MNNDFIFHLINYLFGGYVMKTKLKKTVSLLLSVFIVVMSMNVGLVAQAANFTYNGDKAIEYAKNHWNDGNGLCAEFVANCLLAGGFPDKLSSVAGLSGFAGQITKYGKKVTSSTTGTVVPVKLSSFNGTLKKGDPICILYSKNSGSGNGHVVIYSGETTSDGIVKIYAHNKAKNNDPLYAGYSGSPAIEIFAVNLSDNNTPSVPEKPTNVQCSTVNDLLNISWNSVSGASSYAVYVYSKANCSEIALKKTVTTNSINNINLEPGRYWIYVHAINSAGASAGGGPVNYLSGPRNLKYSVQDNNLTLTWDAVSGANCYDVILTKPNGETSWLHTGENKKVISGCENGNYKAEVQSLYRENGSTTGQIVGAHSQSSSNSIN